MKKTSADTSAEVDGAYLRAVVSGVADATGYFEDRSRRLLVDHDLPSQPEPGESYSLDRFLDLLETIERDTGPNTLNRIGQAVPKHVTWSRTVTDVPSALAQLGTAVDRLHTSTPCSYEFLQTGHATGQLSSTTPYPEAFERGLLEGIGRLFGTGTGFVSIDRMGGSTDERTYRVTWLAEERERTSITVSDATATAARSTRSGAAGD